MAGVAGGLLGGSGPTGAGTAVRELPRQASIICPASTALVLESAAGRQAQRVDGARRIHMEDLAQVRDFYPERKYEGSFETAAALVFRRQDLDSYLEFIWRLFFSFVIGNGDMHLKNISLIYRNPRRPVISPAYDLVSTAPHRLIEMEDFGLKLCHSRRFESIGPHSFYRLAQRVGAPVDATREAVDAVAACLPEAWEQVSDLLKVLPEHRKWLAERIPKVVQRFSACE
ncbi:hypothetical protein HMPREF1531_01497 [Propionibacterium sp. oral taxon 192 str. F0372]|nr:hypothetical protein HMPREF1531_01497 [Propionibacterium sp. oral taxon 192 str. F0372]